MPYQLPTFNLTCNISTSGLYPVVRLSSVCNLQMSRRLAFWIFNSAPLWPFSSTGMWLLLPAGTDARSGLSATGQDTVEVPAGSGRLYLVANVDDVGKGFANEYRVALLLQTAQPTPLP